MSEPGCVSSGKIRVMTVDDHEIFRGGIAFALDAYEDVELVGGAHSGEEALRRLEKNSSVEVVILDVKMPGMDGIETLQAIKKRHPLAEVIMLTGHATVESAIDGMKMGAFDYLMKPCDMEVLMAKVEEAAAKKRAHEEKIIEARVKEITARRA